MRLPAAAPAPLRAFAKALTPALALALALAAAGSGCGPPPPPPPNVILIIADDLGFGDVGFLGSGIRTPALDRLAREGVVLERFYTAPTCTPARAGLLTGRYPHRFGMQRTIVAPWSRLGIPSGEALLGERLAAAGYDRRHLIGKWHLGHARREFHPLENGFTSFYGHLNGEVDHFEHTRLGEVDWHRDLASAAEEGHTTELLAREAVRVIDEAEPGRPFLLWLAFSAPHRPLQALDEDLASYGFAPDLGSYAGNADAVPRRGRGNNKRQTFAAMVTGLDRAAGAVLDALDRKGIAGDTLVWFLSDNGADPREGGSNAPLRGGKTSAEEGGVRVPSVLRWPAGGIAGGRRVSGNAAYVDVAPTVLAAALAPLNAPPLDGIDLAPHLRAGGALPARTIFLDELAAVDGEWKLLGRSLHHVAEDPGETRDVAALHPDVVARFEKELERFRAAIRAPLPDPGEAEKDSFRPPPRWSP